MVEKTKAEVFAVMQNLGFLNLWTQVLKYMFFVIIKTIEANSKKY
jgi:hypothetical protein